MSKKILKSTSLMMLILMIIAMAELPLTVNAVTSKTVTPLSFGTETYTGTGSSDVCYSFVVPGTGTLKVSKGSKSYKDLTFKIYDSKEKLDAESSPLYSAYDSRGEEYEITKAGTYYISMCAKCYFTLSFQQDYSNQSVKTAKPVSVDMNKSITVTQERTDGTHQYYSLSPDDKSYYEFELTTNGGIVFYTSAGKRYFDTASVADVTSLGKKKIAVNAGSKTLVFGIYGTASKGAASVKITRTDFIDIKKLSFSSSSISISGKKAITLKADLGKDVNGKAITQPFESTITYTMKNSSGKKVNYFTVDKSNKLKVTVGNNYNAGVYTLTATTSEGVKATATIKLGLSAIDMKNGTSSTGTVNSSTVKWAKKALAAKYYVYLLKSGKYTKVGETTGTSYTFKNLKANTTYSFKIAAVSKDTVNGKTVYITGAQSEVWKFVTAANTKPTLKSASCSSCKYTAGKAVYGYWDAGGVWHAPYTTASYSTATIKTSFSAVKGAKSYYSNSGSLISKGTYTIKLSGKSKATTKKVKIRACYELSNYKSKAYGPWSAEKSVKIPAAK